MDTASVWGKQDMHLFLWAEDSEAALRSELTQAFSGTRIQSPHPLVLATEFEMAAGRPLPHLVFSRQWLPNARSVQAESIRAWANALLEAVVGVLPEDQPWGLHIAPHYGVRAAHRIGARAWHSATRERNTKREGRRAEGAPENSSEPSLPPIDTEAGQHRCRLIREALMELLQRKRRHLLRQLRREPAAFTPSDSVVQLLLTSPEAGFLSVAP
ncbi:MAG TPA: hypothetical protein VNT26_07660, partial [Candidatus Sulfotelmatobacter sp.]|nr:hypothetical protein [Candidatus Sulfotelmatobacter sp.]